MRDFPAPRSRLDALVSGETNTAAQEMVRAPVLYEIVVRPTFTDGSPDQATPGRDLEFVVVRMMDSDPEIACQRAILFSQRTFGPREVVAGIMPSRKD